MLWERVFLVLPFLSTFGKVSNKALLAPMALIVRHGTR